MNRLRQLGKDSMIYGMGGIAAKGVSFLTLPIYTRIFSPAEYGSIEMLAVISSFLAALLVMGMDSAQSMYFFKHKDEGLDTQASLVSSILQFRLLFGGTIVVLSTLLAPTLNAVFFEGKLGPEYFAFAFANALFTQILNQSSEIMRLLYRPWGYISITLGQAITATCLVLIIVLYFDGGILGFFMGTAISSFLVGSFGWFRVRRYLNFRKVHSEWWPQLIKFGLPLVPAGLATYFMTTCDRWFVQHYYEVKELGIFAIGAKFSMIMTIAVETFRKAWWPIAMDSMQSDDGPKTFRLIARVYMGCGTTCVVALTMLSPWLLKWFAGPLYANAWPIVGILAWQSLFYGFYLIAAAGIWKTEKTYLNLYIMLFAVGVGVLLNWLLVPKYGGEGAAFATALTHFISTFISLFVSQRLWSINLFDFSLVIQIAIGVSAAVWMITSINEHFILRGSVVFALLLSNLVIFHFHLKSERVS